MFCQYLRAHILGANIHRIVQTPNDRIVWFELTKNDDRFFLVAALIGRSANIFVLNDQAIILRSLKPGKVFGRIEGQPFALAPVPLAAEIPQDRQEPFPRFHAVQEPGFPVSQRIEERYRIAEQDECLEVERKQQTAHLRKHIKKLQRRIERLTKDCDRVDLYREYGRYGELLKSRVFALRTGQSHIRVVDYFDEALPTLTLPLNPEKNGPANLEEYFKKYRKFSGAQRDLVPRLEETKNEVANLQNELYELESGKTTDVFENQAGRRTNGQQNTLRRLTPQRPSAAGYRRFCSLDGYAILVGKNTTENDALTFKMSKPDDLWLHARGIPGSHVIVELKKQRVPPETLKDAALLALVYSDLRKNGKGEILYTLRKNVRKPKGAKPGSVTVTREKTVWASVDQIRLVRLKESKIST